jgi:hypothetical protein
MATVDAQRIRFITRNHRKLQGLKVLPLAVLLLVFSIGEMGWHLGTWWIALLLATLVTAPVATAAIAWWYRQGYGWVAPTYDRAALVVVALGIAAVALSFLPAWRDAPISASGFLLGLTAIVPGWRWRRFVPHWLVGGVVIAVVSLAPLGAVLPAAPGAAASAHPFNGAWLPVAMALTLGVLGVLDHRVLVRHLRTGADALGDGADVS